MKKSHSKIELNSRAHQASRMYKFVALTYRIKRAPFSISHRTHSIRRFSWRFCALWQLLEKIISTLLLIIIIKERIQRYGKNKEWIKNENELPDEQESEWSEWRGKRMEKNKPNHKTLFEWFQPENMNETLTVSVLNAIFNATFEHSFYHSIFSFSNSL